MRWEEASGGQKVAGIGCLGVALTLLLVVLFTCTAGGGQSSRSATATSASNCISEWTGSHTLFVNAVKRRLADAGSFKHVETWHSSAAYPRTVVMKYTAKSAAGVTLQATARGTYGSDCAVTVETIQG